MLSREGKQTDRGAVGAEFIGYNRRRREALLLQEFPHQPNCRPSVPAGLNQEIQDFALTVHGTPEIELPPSNYDDHLVQVPAFGRSWPPTLNPPRIGPTEFQDPSSNCLIRDVETTLGKQVLNVPIAQRETAIEPDGMLDDDRWKAVTTVGYLAHPETLKHRPCRSHAVNVTMPVAAFTASTRIADIPPDVVHLGKKSILDSLATGLSGSVAPGSVLMRRYVETLGCSAGSCMVIGSALRLPPRFAALANGTAMHIDDFDDTWQSRPDGPRARHTARMGVHPSGPVLSAVLAAAEGEGRSGADVLAACLVGVEVCCAVLDATDAVEVDNALHTTSSCALVGAAAGVANLRGLGEQDVRRMLGIACDQTGGLTAQAGTMAKSWHGGRAAESAIVAADLTELGFTAEESVLEHPGGYFHTNSPSIDYHQSMGKR